MKISSKAKACFAMIASGAFAAFLSVSIASAAPAPATKAWVSVGSDGRLVYQSTTTGDRIPDYSSAGYMGGGVKLPKAEVGATLAPVAGGADDTARIQKALDAVAERATSEHPLALVLAPGTYNCSGNIRLNHNGLVLRGGGATADKVVIKMTGAPHVCIKMGDGEAKSTGGAVSPGVAAPKGYDGRALAQSGEPITDAYVPCGATTVTLRSASGFKVGDEVAVIRPITAKWVALLKMDKLVGKDGKAQHWLGPNDETVIERKIKAINGNKITLEVPINDSIDSTYLNPPGGKVAKLTPIHRYNQMGLENITIIAGKSNFEVGKPQYDGLQCSNVEDCWVTNVILKNNEAGLGINSEARRMTFKQFAILHDYPAPSTGAKFPDITANGYQILFYKCEVQGDYRFPYCCGPKGIGPNVLLDFKIIGKSWLQPHMKWSTGLLIDNCQATNGGSIDIINRNTMGSGHGWAMAWCTVWNTTAEGGFTIDTAPGTLNWAIGSIGDFKRPRSSPAIQSTGKHVAPASLYRAQLADRLGPQAVANLDAE